ncbi:MAG: APC family permease, partial [Actinomycetes bacterium]
YGRARIGATAGFAAGWAFTAGKISSLVAMALTFGAYAVPGQPRLGALAAVIALTAVNLAGITRTATAAKVGAVLVAVVLLAIAGATIGSSATDSGNLTPVTGYSGMQGVLGGAGIMFFAFAGYARIATLGEEVRDPKVTIPRAVPIALATAFVLYALAIGGSLLVLGPQGLADSSAPLADAVDAAGAGWLAPFVRAGAAVGALGVLLSLLAGVARTIFAMADDRELPHLLSAVHGGRRVPHIAQLAVGTIVAVLVLFVPTLAAIATSSVCILTYYSIAHLAALRLKPEDGRPLLLAPFGLFGCAAIGLSLPGEDVLAGLGLIALGLLGRALALSFSGRR